MSGKGHDCNALKLLVFFYSSFLGPRNFKSVFLILKISQYGSKFSEAFMQALI